MAGGDVGGTLPGVGIFLATSTNSTPGAEIYEAVSDAFSITGGPLNFSREASATAVPLGVGGETLIIGGSHCYPNSFDNQKTISTAAFASGVVTITATAATGFDAGQTVVIAGNSTAGNNGTFTIASITSATKFTYADAGGGAGTGGTATQNPNAACTGATSGFECDALNTAELYNESTGKFAVAGSGSGGVMTTARSGANATKLADGTILVVGGSTGSSFLGFGPGVPVRRLAAVRPDRCRRTRPRSIIRRPTPSPPPRRYLDARVRERSRHRRAAWVPSRVTRCRQCAKACRLR